MRESETNADIILLVWKQALFVMKRKRWDDEWKLRSPNLLYLKKRKGRGKKWKSDFDLSSIEKELLNVCTFQYILTIYLINLHYISNYWFFKFHRSFLLSKYINTMLTSILILKLKNHNSNPFLSSFFALQINQRIYSKSR